MENQAKLYAPVIDMTSQHDVTEEFTLPDYVPAIRRIVSCKAEILPEGKYVHDGEASLSGLVAYSVLYIGEDGGLSCAPLNSEYKAKIACPGCDGLRECELAVRTYSENVICRATGPRRLHLSCRMRSQLFGVRAVEIKDEVLCSEPEEKVCAADIIGVERHIKEKSCCSAAFATYTGQTSGELRVRDGAKVLSCDGSAGVNDVRMDGEFLVVRGDVYITCMILDEKGEYSSVKGRAPFEDRVPITLPGSLPEGASYAPTATVRCASAGVEGDGGMLSWEAEYDIEGTVCISYACSYTDDAYSTLCESHGGFAECDTLDSAHTCSTRMSVNSSKQLKSEGRSVAMSYGKAVCKSCEPDGTSHAVLSGSCSVYAVLVGEGEAVCEELEIPFSYRCPVGDVQSAVSCMCTPSVLYTDARIEGDRLVCDVEIALEAIIFERGKERYLSCLTLDKSSPLSTGGSQITICFPYKDESLWDIAKKYRCREGCVLREESRDAVVIVK